MDKKELNLKLREVFSKYRGERSTPIILNALKHDTIDVLKQFLPELDRSLVSVIVEDSKGYVWFKPGNAYTFNLLKDILEEGINYI